MNNEQFIEYKKSLKNYQDTINHDSLLKISHKNLKKNFEKYMKDLQNTNVIKFKTKTDLEKWTKFTQKNINNIFKKKKKIRKNPDHSELIVKTCSYRSYYMFKIVDQIWKNEKIEKEDLKMVPNIFWIFIYQMVSGKFKIQANISNIDVFFFQLSNLRLNFNKRKEEILKFVLKRFLKKIFFKEIFNKNENFLFILHNEFFKNQIEMKYFKNLFFENDNNKIPIIKKFDYFMKLLNNNFLLKKEFLIFLGNLVNDHKKEITKKFFYIFKIMKKRFKDKSKFMETFQNTAFNKGRKCFVTPWTVIEVQKSVDFIRENIIK